ncbi:hypothetical protein OXPF_29790 [Oxobacter pfennigii]|uniref:DUF2785 domain-containing protein n=1 Tax=Oxobacter pfennigii TaxID=36849 RepID=A0A0P8W6X4_9CLOT|nr:DUF2785 domain-containing protein [Oxobacter pfennigii]KPU43538.1 hypothetical protein OXPF_29790 [Oxobacter pfennigii]
MDRRKRLILELRKIQENQYKVAETKKQWEYIVWMLEYIGDTDPELRDDLIYNTLYEWIDVKEYFNEDQLRHILFILLDEKHLFYQIGSDGNDSVFTRTFSSLGVALILNRHRKKAFLSIDEFIEIKNKFIGYYTSEMDLRGYIQGSGWAHGTAHGADVMDELVQCSESDGGVIREILKAFKKVMYNGKYIFCNEEDERISRVVFRIIKENLLSKHAIIKWLEELSECIEWQRDRLQYVARVNAKNFVRCLYFKMMHYDNTLDIIDEIFKSEEKLNRFLQLDQELIEKMQI